MGVMQGGQTAWRTSRSQKSSSHPELSLVRGLSTLSQRMEWKVKGVKGPAQ